ncbi:MAG: hypothetical protein KDE57_07350 [Calditrichaeota bacterium]|nr:hypothetical protein [Calditrichota bacterium]MCB9066227.1 hypothetical protein [Calditrichia bacterium]
MFCRETVEDIRKAAEKNPDYPDVLFFYQGTVEDGQSFFDRYWPEARAVSDIPLHFYHGFGIKRGGIMEIFSPMSVACSIRATAKGHTIGKPVGDPMVMPGLFLVKGESVLWTHKFNHIGDHPDFAKVAQIV